MKLGRQKSGDAVLDDMLDGGFTKGRLILVRGPKAVGPQHLGVLFASRRRSLILDLSPCPADFAHSTIAYAQRNWRPRQFDRSMVRGPSDIMHIYQCLGHLADLSIQPSPDEYQKLCNRIVRNREWIGRFLYDGFSRGIKRLVIDGIQSLATPLGGAQRTILAKIFSEFVHVPPNDLLSAAKLDGLKGDYKPADIGVMVIAQSKAEFLGTLVQETEFRWDAAIDHELLPFELRTTSNPTWQPRECTTELRMGRIQGHADFCLYIPKHNLSSHSPGPRRYTIDPSTRSLCLKGWF